MDGNGNNPIYSLSTFIHLDKHMNGAIDTSLINFIKD